MSLNVNRLSPEWLTVERYINERIAELHLRLENPMDLSETSLIRGQIRALRDLIASAQPTPALDAEEDTHPYA